MITKEEMLAAIALARDPSPRFTEDHSKTREAVLGKFKDITNPSRMREIARWIVQCEKTNTLALIGDPVKIDTYWGDVEVFAFFEADKFTVSIGREKSYGTYDPKWVNDYLQDMGTVEHLDFSHQSDRQAWLDKITNIMVEELTEGTEDSVTLDWSFDIYVNTNKGQITFELS